MCVLLVIVCQPFRSVPVQTRKQVVKISSSPLCWSKWWVLLFCILLSNWKLCTHVMILCLYSVVAYWDLLSLCGIIILGFNYLPQASTSSSSTPKNYWPLLGLCTILHRTVYKTDYSFPGVTNPISMDRNPLKTDIFETKKINDAETPNNFS